jgi:predicted acyltransferase
MVLLAVIYLLADVLKFQKWGTFFLVFGTNAIFAYSLAGIWTKTMLYIIKIPSGGEQVSLYRWLYQEIFVPLAGNMNGSFLFAITQLMIVWLVVLILYRRKIFIKL